MRVTAFPEYLPLSVSGKVGIVMKLHSGRAYETHALQLAATLIVGLILYYPLATAVCLLVAGIVFFICVLVRERNEKRREQIALLQLQQALQLNRQTVPPAASAAPFIAPESSALTMEH